MAGKRGVVPKTAWPKGKSGNPKGGRPKAENTWSAVAARVGAMSPKQAAELCKALSGRLLTLGDKASMKELAVMTAYATTLFEPSASLLNFLADREEGKVPFPVEQSGPEGGPMKIVFEYADDTGD